MCEMEERNRYDAEFAETIDLSRMFEGRIDGCSEREDIRVPPDHAKHQNPPINCELPHKKFKN